MGNASYGGNRADVCAAFAGKPGCPRVGWNFRLDTTLVPDGPHTLQVTFIPVSGQGFTATTPFDVANLGTANNPTLLSIDRPNAASGPLAGQAALGGWALNSHSPISTVEVSVDGISNGYAIYGGIRTDACGRHAGATGCPNVGWDYVLDTTVLANGPHSLEVTVTPQNGQRASAGVSFTVSNSEGAGPTTTSIAIPNSQSSPYQGRAVFSGTALSTSAAITQIVASIDGYPYGLATYTPAGVNSTVAWTYSLNTVQLADGVHTFAVTTKAADGTSSIASVSFTVANWTSPSPIRVSIDRPNSSSPIFTGTAFFGGWALTPNAVISGVTLSIDGVPFGPAAYGSDRSDVCRTYKNQPGCPNVGWNAAVDTTFLANGTHTVAATATTATGQSSTVSSSFTVGN